MRSVCFLSRRSFRLQKSTRFYWQNYILKNKIEHEYLIQPYINVLVSHAVVFSPLITSFNMHKSKTRKGNVWKKKLNEYTRFPIFHFLVRCATPYNWRAECSWCNRMYAMAMHIACGHAVFVFLGCKVFLFLRCDRLGPSLN